ncbi:hypothetical protein LCGC14_0771310 [marine sediment metagenome]|uniref:DUF4468 domain-containing protein n=1 Tax=marine sediment metagenome TaxID=412755 RepID=A0A0F9Q2D8_9ZZZZ
MQKTFLVALTVLFTNWTFGQGIDQLKLTPLGVEAIVVELDSSKASDIYKKSLVWLQETYKNPDEVLKANIENEKIRINGFANNAWSFKALGMEQFMDMEYSVEISFKDGKYRFDYTIGQFYTNAGTKALYTYSSFYKKNGEVRKMYQDAVPTLELTMNSLSQSFYNYASGITTEKDDDW